MLLITKSWLEEHHQPRRYGHSLLHFALTWPLWSHTCKMGHISTGHITALFNENKTAGAWCKSFISLPIQQSLHNWTLALAADDAEIWTLTDCINTQRKRQIRGVKHAALTLASICYRYGVLRWKQIQIFSSLPLDTDAWHTSAEWANGVIRNMKYS